MEVLSELVRIYLNPSGLFVGVSLVLLTGWVVGRMYKDETDQDSSRSLLEEFAKVCTNSKYEGTSGLRLPDYFDADRLLLRKWQMVDQICDRLGKILEEYPSKKICFIEKDSGPVGALTIAGSLVSKLRRPVSVVRPDRDIIKMRVEGEPINKGDQVILVQDLLTRAFQVIRAIRALEAVGAQVVVVVALVDREEEKDPEFRSKRIKVINILTLSQIRNYVIEETSKKSAGQRLVPADYQ